MGLVCFRLIGSDKLNEKLLSNINGSGKLHMVPASVRDKYIIRFCAVAQHSTDDDIGLCLGTTRADGFFGTDRSFVCRCGLGNHHRLRHRAS